MVTNGRLEDDGGRLGGLDELLQVRHDEADGNEEEETGDRVDDNSTDHGLGDHDGGFAHFFTQTALVSAYPMSETGTDDETHEIIMPVADVA